MKAGEQIPNSELLELCIICGNRVGGDERQSLNFKKPVRNLSFKENNVIASRYEAKFSYVKISQPIAYV